MPLIAAMLLKQPPGPVAKLIAAKATSPERARRLDKIGVPRQYLIEPAVRRGVALAPRTAATGSTRRNRVFRRRVASPGSRPSVRASSSGGSSISPSGRRRRSGDPALAGPGVAGLHQRRRVPVARTRQVGGSSRSGEDARGTAPCPRADRRVAGSRTWDARLQAQDAKAVWSSTGRSSWHGSRASCSSVTPGSPWGRPARGPFRTKDIASR